MKNLLQLNTSINSRSGDSTRLAEDFVARWREDNPQGQVIIRDLAQEPVPHLTAERFEAFLTKPEARTAEQATVAAYSDGLIDELRRADVVVIGLPLYNFGVPSTLKAYFDHIARAGVTFRYTDSGSVGLLRGKKVYVIATRGGLYAGTGLDHQIPHVRQFLGFLGMTDVEFVYAEGLAISGANRDKALAKARTALALLAQDEWRVAA